MFHDPILVSREVFEKLMKRYGTQLVDHSIIKIVTSKDFVTVAVGIPEANDTLYRTCLKSEVSGYLFGVSDNGVADYKED